ncbi:hypothetical protein Y032_0126g1349 [Ancylostoma ceylanicum]|uniref:Uncharacterized protein n=2 Tax=Ancylostoma ceylanicum TaxID=53326 RepID=A0A016T8Q7_9BILA|nr:hypothetical protein Y032_0126g1349 [Ancylostoma ceylanicum]
MVMPLAVCPPVEHDVSRHEYTAPTSQMMMVKPSMKMPPLPPPLLDDELEQDLLLMPVWKQNDGLEIVYVIHRNRAVTREVYVDGVKKTARYAGEFTEVNYEPWIVFVNHLPIEDSLIEEMKCTQPAHRGHSPQYGYLPDDYAGGYLRKNQALLENKLTELAAQREGQE